jgi:mRNA-degrading endonuclease RelE of RelBE toxin-antitoxin system
MATARLKLFGDHRVVYEVRDDEFIVLVVRIADRRDIYRRAPP